MANAKQEIIDHIGHRNGKVKCASISYRGVGPEKLFVLKENYTSPEYDLFLSSLDFEYDNGYGGQELFGVIWYDDGTWSDRGEYDGSEWWMHQCCPSIPTECSPE